MPYKRRRCTILLALLLLLLSPAATWSAAGAKVEFSSGRISIVAENATLSSIAEQISKAAGVSVYLDRSQEGRKASADLRDASFEKALKNLVHPLNFVIVSDRNGTVTELRIFKNPGLREGEYRLFAATRPSDDKPVPPPERPPAAPKGSTQVPSAQVSLSPSSAASRLEPSGSLSGTSQLLTGETAFQASIWTNKQIIQAEQRRQNIQVKAQQTELQKAEAASVASMIQMSSPNVQKEQTPVQQTSSGVLSAQQSQQSSEQAYQQYLSQQRGFSSYTYYQQRMMSQSFSFYSMRRGQP